MNRTLQFIMPPRLVSPASSARPVKIVSSSRRRFVLTLTALVASALCLAAVLFWQARAGVASEAASPVGIWDTTLQSKASSNAQLEFAFERNGTGFFSWRETGPASRSGQTPLTWRQNTDGTLSLAVIAAEDDPMSQTLAGIFSSHPWPVHRDRKHRQLVLGTLIFTEKP